MMEEPFFLKVSFERFSESAANDTTRLKPVHTRLPEGHVALKQNCLDSRPPNGHVAPSMCRQQ